MPAIDNKSPQGQSLSGVNVLITRPTKFAGYLIDAIKSRGGYPVPLPAVHVEFTVEGSRFEQLLSSGKEHQMIIFTSRNGVDAISDWMVKQNMHWPGGLIFAAVGPKTAEAMQLEFGVNKVIYPNSNYGIDSLLDMEEMEDLSQTNVALIDGGGTNSVRLLEMLKKRKASSTQHCIVYKRKIPEIDTHDISDFLSSNSMHYVVITSTTGASNLSELLGRQQSDRLKTACAIAYSERIAEFLRLEGFDQVVVPDQPSDDAVVNLMEELGRANG